MDALDDRGNLTEAARTEDGSSILGALFLPGVYQALVAIGTAAWISAIPITVWFAGLTFGLLEAIRDARSHQRKRPGPAP